MKNDTKISIVPIFQDEAFEFINRYHRHHKAPIGSLFQIAAAQNDTIVAVVVVGRPIARRLDDGFTAEVIRLCSDGTPNACSMLYAAAWRAAKAIGYRKLITYILNTEPGTTLKAAGWKLIGERGGGSWNVRSRPRVDKHPTQKKILFEII